MMYREMRDTAVVVGQRRVGRRNVMRRSTLQGFGDDLQQVVRAGRRVKRRAYLKGSPQLGAGSSWYLGTARWTRLALGSWLTPKSKSSDWL